MRLLGERRRSIGLLDQSVDAFRLALEEFAADRVPAAWASTVGNEALALRAMAKIKGASDIATTALSQLIKARGVFLGNGHEVWAEACTEWITETEALIEELSSGNDA